MKTLPAFLIAASFLAAAEIQAQAPFDSVRFQHQMDSAWYELRSYDFYGWAFQWDSIFMVRWTSWTCDDIHDREDERRASEDAYLRKRFEETSAPFPEYTNAKKRKTKNELTERR
jgi:hypothetical protein